MMGIVQDSFKRLHYPSEIMLLRNIKKRYKAMLGFKSFRTASIILSGIEFMHILHKKQFEVNNQKEAAPVFYELMS